MNAEKVKARPSSTVVLARESSAGPEILMVRRNADSMFGSAYVFPGGVLETSDAKVHHRCADITEQQACRMMGTDTAGLDYYSAAIRELFEETGVLLAIPSRSQSQSQKADRGTDLRESRDKLNESVLRWDEFLEQADLTLDCGKLLYFSHWITPAFLPKRYSTRFFLAPLPPGQEATHDGAELTDSCWMTPTGVLEAERSGEMTVHFPTLRTLSSLSRHSSLTSLQQWARFCSDSGVPVIKPKRVERNGKPQIVIPGDEGYPDE